jgi:hypothetical protein
MLNFPISADRVFPDMERIACMRFEVVTRKGESEDSSLCNRRSSEAK